jgi:hypothetical protein
LRPRAPQFKSCKPASSLAGGRKYAAADTRRLRSFAGTAADELADGSRQRHQPEGNSEDKSSRSRPRWRRPKIPRTHGNGKTTREVPCQFLTKQKLSLVEPFRRFNNTLLLRFLLFNILPSSLRSNALAPKEGAGIISMVALQNPTPAVSRDY